MQTEEHMIFYCRSQFGGVSFSNIVDFLLCWSGCSSSRMSFDFADIWLKLSLSFLLVLLWILLLCEIVLCLLYFLQFDSSVLFVSLLAFFISVYKIYHLLCRYACSNFTDKTAKFYQTWYVVTSWRPLHLHSFRRSKVKGQKGQISILCSIGVRKHLYRVP